jgi:DNA-binding CsgD family transcriptional regulator
MDRQMTTTPSPTDLSAQELMGIISSGSIPVLGQQCQAALERYCGSPAMGLYLLRSGVPELLFASDVPDGFLTDYATLYSADDPLIRQLSAHVPVTDGRSCLGEEDWARSDLRALLRSWGFGHNMCGLISIDEATVGVIYTAGPRSNTPFTPRARDQMGFLCRGAGIALRSLVRRQRMAGDLPPQLARVATLVCEGFSNKEIARAVGLSEHTVKEYVQRLAQRLRADNRTALAVTLLRQGFLH